MEEFRRMFKGTYRHRIDAKGRVPVPAAFRRQLALGQADRVIVTLMDQCLSIYPIEEWTRLEDQLRGLPVFSRPVKALTRLLMSRAVECELDVQGRILLPGTLREDAGLVREALIVGVLNRFEIWSPEAWTAFLRDSDHILEDLSSDLWPAPPVSGMETASIHNRNLRKR
ncbi:MAG: division/cell wall cluster transcriptional repressor MraZ [Vicinamibacteria bacterium]|nr:division/cell wall cluster transcriptional repressor MraZ [Vicinamibacteria bacterium]